jgi:drug/metabolite transporter (DMT)-like permease
MIARQVLPQAANSRAILLILVSTALFGLGDALIKLLSESWPVAQIIALRSFFCLCLLAVLRRRGEPLLPAGILDRTNLARSGFEVGVTFGFFLGASLMPLGQAVSIMFLAPILLTALAALILKEHVGWRRWTAVLLGFAGVLIVMRPGGEEWSLAALLPLVAALSIAGRDIAVRRLSPSVSTRAVVFATSLVVFLASALVSAFVWQPLGPKLVLGSVICACTVTAAFFCYVAATRTAEVSSIQPFKYLALPYAFLLGFLIWGDRPDGTALAGAGLIVVSGLFILHRQQVKRSEARTEEQAASIVTPQAALTRSHDPG